MYHQYNINNNKKIQTKVILECSFLAYFWSLPWVEQAEMVTEDGGGGSEGGSEGGSSGESVVGING
jgi:hypothetical protein